MSSEPRYPQSPEQEYEYEEASVYPRFPEPQPGERDHLYRAAVGRIAAHLGYCPHSEPEDEAAGSVIQTMLERIETLEANLDAAYLVNEELRQAVARLSGGK